MKVGIKELIQIIFEKTGKTYTRQNLYSLSERYNISEKIGYHRFFDSDKFLEVIEGERFLKKGRPPSIIFEE